MWTTRVSEDGDTNAPDQRPLSRIPVVPTKAERPRSDGILVLPFGAAGKATGCLKVQVSPHRSPVSFGRAVKAKRQGRGFDGACGLATVECCCGRLARRLSGALNLRKTSRMRGRVS